MFVLLLFQSIVTTFYGLFLRYLVCAQVPHVTLQLLPLSLHGPSPWKLRRWGHLLCPRMPLTLLFVTGHHRPFGEEPLAHSLQELHDDQRPQGQLGRELHDHHDRNTVLREEEH